MRSAGSLWKVTVSGEVPDLPATEDIHAVLPLPTGLLGSDARITLTDGNVADVGLISVSEESGHNRREFLLVSPQPGRSHVSLELTAPVGSKLANYPDSCSDGPGAHGRELHLYLPGYDEVTEAFQGSPGLVPCEFAKVEVRFNNASVGKVLPWPYDQPWGQDTVTLVPVEHNRDPGEPLVALSSIQIDVGYRPVLTVGLVLLATLIVLTTKRVREWLREVKGLAAAIATGVFAGAITLGLALSSSHRTALEWTSIILLSIGLSGMATVVFLASERFARRFSSTRQAPLALQGTGEQEGQGGGDAS